MKKNKKEKNLLINILEKIVMLLIIVLFGYFSYHYLKSAINNKEEKIIEYKTNSNATSYKVYLLENSFFEEPYLGMDKKYYISNLIDYIDIDFNYNLNYSDFVSGKYSYFIRGILSANTPKNDNTNYWSKTYNLSEEQYFEFDKTNGFNINANAKVNYQKYNTILNDFKKEYGIAFDGIFKVQLVISSTATSKEFSKEIPVDSLVEIDIPLTQQIIDVAIDFSQNDEEGKVYDIISEKNGNYYVLMGLGCLFGLLTIFLIIYLIFSIKKMLIEISIYEKTLRKILNTYDSVIINTSVIPKMNNLNIIEVSSFSELIDAHSEVRMPINYIEEVKNYKSVFILISDKLAWKYTLINAEYKKRLGKKSKKETKKDSEG